MPFGYSVQEVKTPAYALDLPVFKKNCEQMVNKAKSMGLKLRVHVKTHKTAEGGRIQLEGIPQEDQAIIVSTMAELKFFADRGFNNITLGIPFGTHQLHDLALISKRIQTLCVLVDMEEHIDLLDTTDGTYSVFIKIDTGYHRAGLDAYKTEPILKLARRICSSPRCTFLGLYSHAGHSYDQSSVEAIRRVAKEERDGMVHVRQALEKEGIPVSVVSCGSTPACSLSDDWEGITEIHAGNYCCYDRFQAAIGSCASEEMNAGRLVSRILSVYPDRNTILTDGGGIPLSKDKSDMANWGTVKDHPELYVYKISQEHAILTSDSPIDFSKYPIGTVLQTYVNHSCMTAAQHEEFLIVDGDKVIDKWVPAKFW